MSCTPNQESPLVGPAPKIKAAPTLPIAAAQVAVKRFLPELIATPGLVDQVADALLEMKALASRATEGKAKLLAVRAAIQAATLPEVMVGIPLFESSLDDSAVSMMCAAGGWQFMPETAAHFGLKVSGCTLNGSTELFTPAPTDKCQIKTYVKDDQCLISHCAVDERMDFAASTSAAVRLLQDAYLDPTLAAHAQHTALAVLSFNAGKETVLSWLPSRGPDAFAGLAACKTVGCGALSAESAVYVPHVIAGAAYAACVVDPNDPMCADLPG